MFKDIISETPFCNATANDYFDNICGNTYGYDNSFVSTLRALLMNRADGQSIEFQYYKLGVYSSSDVSANTIKYAVDDLQWNSIWIYDCCMTSNQETIGQWMTFVKENFTNLYPDFAPVEKVGLFFKKSFPVLCFIDAERKNTVLFVANLDIKKYHYLQCAIPAFLPWYFDSSGLSPLEMRLIESLREKTSAAYASCLAEIIAPLNLREYTIRKQLAGFELSVERSRLNVAQREVEKLVNEINRRNSEIADLFEQKYAKDIVILGLETKISNMQSNDSELLEYFLTNKKLDLVYANNGTVRFICHDYLTYVDEDQALSYLANPSSYFYAIGNGAGNHCVSDADIRRFFEALLVKQKIKLRVCASYDIIIGRGVNPNGYNYGMEYNSYLPNPHIHLYRCMGNYVKLINECVARGDYISAIEQCIASNKSLNISDGTVMRAFVKGILGEGGASPARCIELPDGAVTDIVGALKYLKETEDN